MLSLTCFAGKGCNYFGVKFVGANIDQKTGRVDLNDVRSKVNGNTVALVGNAPSFPHGVIDDIEGLSKIALKHNLGLHVDCCLGGFHLPFLEKLGHLRKEAKFDFRVAGVTTMSADIHKYGFGPKGSSCCLFRTAELRRHAFFAWTEWSGGMYASPSISGSRSGGIIAAAYTTLMVLGEEGYLKLVEEIWQTFSKVRDGIARIKGMELMGPPEACCIGFRCTDGPENKIYKVACCMKEKYGWNINYLQKPMCCGIQIGRRHDFDSDKFLTELQQAVDEVNADPEKYSGGLAQTYGTAAKLPDRDVVGDLLKVYLDETYKA